MAAMPESNTLVSSTTRKVSMLQLLGTFGTHSRHGSVNLGQPFRFRHVGIRRFDATAQMIKACLHPPNPLEQGPINATIHKIDECMALANIEPLARIYEETFRKLME